MLVSEHENMCQRLRSVQLLLTMIVQQAGGTYQLKRQDPPPNLHVKVETNGEVHTLTTIIVEQPAEQLNGEVSKIEA